MDGVKYLPEFFFPQVNMWGEAKSVGFNEKEEMKAVLLSVYSGCEVLMFIGPPEPRSYWAISAIKVKTSEAREVHSYYGVKWDLVFDENNGHPSETIIGSYTDYILDADHLHEGRFFADTGNTYPGTEDLSDRFDIVQAVMASRGAKFSESGIY